MNKNYFKNYFNQFSKILSSYDKREFLKIVQIIREIKKNKKKVILVGNGGSAAMASHVSVDLTKQCNIRAINFNEADLITCFANDYGFENWISKTIEHYADKNDILILISSSGRSKNMINACKAAKKKNILKIITLTGHEKNNPLSKLGDINLWIESKAYNFIENTHQLWLLTVCDLIIGKREYPPN